MFIIMGTMTVTQVGHLIIGTIVFAVLTVLCFYKRVRHNKGDTEVRATGTPSSFGSAIAPINGLSCPDMQLTEGDMARTRITTEKATYRPHKGTVGYAVQASNKINIKHPA